MNLISVSLNEPKLNKGLCLASLSNNSTLFIHRPINLLYLYNKWIASSLFYLQTIN